MELNLELKSMLTTTSPVGGWVVGGWTETKLMLSQLKLKLKLELSLAIRKKNLTKANGKS